MEELTLIKWSYNVVCSALTPQIKDIPEDTFARETSNCNIEMYPGKVVALLKEQATFILMWMR